MRNWLGAALALYLAGTVAHAEETCRLMRLASLDMGPEITRVTVPAAINDTPLTMMVDTGGVVTMLSEPKAKELKLPIEVVPDSRLVMYGGIVLHHYVEFSGFTLGKMRAGRLVYPLLPAEFMPPGVDGIIAPDFLANFDVDFDFANAKLNLFSRDHCDGRVVYWTKIPVAKLPFRMDDDVHITFHVQLDGRDEKAVLDTGAQFSVMSLESAKDDFDLKDADLKEARGPNGTKGARRYHFKQLSFADVVVSNPDITLVPDSQAGMGPEAPDIVIGMGILRQLHLYIAYHERNLYISSASQH